ncbi:threonine synthase [Geothrix sp. PMB-07]|uniref:threonine synthase n=1 Tax=Geothrix sp. PMB-07 TaxID=3068640 RepID=UPI002741AA97|nr:threonine synthase [Geothrix sp. PMB-07]WLT32042.1 threonine synthase [Geothrix sp. PMB-07]
MKLVSTRTPTLSATFQEAVQAGLAPDGGLFVPVTPPHFDDVPDLLRADFASRSVEILYRLLGDELSRSVVEDLTRSAFTFPAPLVRVDGRISALELFHGPTLAFKDFGARFLARVLALGAGGQPRTVLTATSGDTGAAVASAFHGLPGVQVVVLYPAGRVSPMQERQFATCGGNVLALAVEGAFDDCQRLVKGAFEDVELVARLGLTSANSINIARLLAQTLYYFEAAAQAEPGQPLVVSVPSGNFGNLTAGLWAQRMGAPIQAFVAATNANRVVPDYLDSGTYQPRPSVATLSNAMDVGSPSNWERIFALFRGDHGAMAAALRWGSCTDAETEQVVIDLDRTGYLADPHGAVAYQVLRSNLREGEQGIFLATAHPAKFRESLAPALGREIPLPKALRDLEALPLLNESLAVDQAALRRRLL